MEDPILRRRDRTATITGRGDIADGLQPPGRTLAYTLIGGTFGGTVLTLVFLPALHAIWFKIKPPGTGRQAVSANSHRTCRSLKESPCLNRKS